MVEFFVLILLFILLAVIYYIPVPHHDFFSLYPEKDLYAQSLKNFRSHQIKTIEFEGAKWEYFSGGNGKKTLLFVHGMGGAYDIWWNQIKTFESQFRIISYTLPKKINSLEKAKKGILAILQKEKIWKFSVIGTSMGGYIAQYLVQKIPDRIEKAVFGNTFPPNNILLQQNKTKRKILPLVPEIILYYLNKKHLNNIILPAAQNSMLLYAFLSALPFSKEQFINRFDIITDSFNTTYDILNNKKIPLLIIESDNDPLIPVELRKQLKIKYQYAKVHTFRQKGHFPYINSAEDYNTVLQNFLEE